MLFMVLTVVLQLAAFVVQGIQCWLEARRAPLILGAGKIIVRRSNPQGGRDAHRILTTHVGSLPRPQQLIERNFKRSRGADRRGAAPAGAHAEVIDLVAPAGGRRRHRQRRRVRPLDGPPVRLRPLVDLHLPATRRAGADDVGCGGADGGAKAGRARSCSGRSATAASGRSSPTRTWTRARASRSRTRHQHGTARRDAARSATGPGGDRARHREPQGRARRRRRRGRLPQLGGPGELRAVRQRALRRRGGADWACADAMREEYVAIVEAGLILQLDDPAIAEN